MCMGAALHFDVSVPNFGIQEYMPHTTETDAGGPATAVGSMLPVFRFGSRGTRTIWPLASAQPVMTLSPTSEASPG